MLRRSCRNERARTWVRRWEGRRSRGADPQTEYPSATTERRCSARATLHQRERPRRCAITDVLLLLGVSVAELVEDRLDPRAVRKERIHAARIEMATALSLQVFDALVERPRFLVGPLRNERVEYVGDGDDARNQRNVFGVQAVGISGAIVFFVVPERDDRAHR